MMTVRENFCRRDAMLLDEIRPFFVRSLIGLAVLNGCIATLAVTFITHYALRIEHASTEVVDARGEMKWSRSYFSASNTASYGKRTAEEVAAWPKLLPSIDSVSLVRGDLADKELQFLSQLTTVRSLVLHSDAASDAVFDFISRMPRLQHLRIRGRNLSATGMLKLRDMKSLQRVEFDAASYSAIEVAVLQTELPSLRAWHEASPQEANALSKETLARSISVEVPAPVLM